MAATDCEKDFLTAACVSGDVPSICEIMKRSLDPVSLCATPPDSVPYLVILCSRGLGVDITNCLDLFISNGCDINAAGPDGVTALLSACSRANAPLVQYLLSRGADCSVKDGRGDSAPFTLMRNILNVQQRQPSVSCDQRNIFQNLFDAGCDVNEKDRHGSTLLQYCCIFDMITGVEVLVSAGANVNDLDYAGFSPVMTCAKLGRVEILQYLLVHSADMHLVFSNTLDAMALACRLGHVEVVDILLKHGYDPNYIMANGSLPIVEALYFRHTNIVKILLERGADVNCRTRQGSFAPLVAACLVGSLDIVKLLISKGADISCRSDQGFTPLMGASGKGNIEIVSFLLNMSSCDINAASNRDGQTALMVACNGDSHDTSEIIVKLLVSRGADVNAKSFSGNTPLMAAASKGNMRVVVHLLSQGANPDLQNEKDKRAVDLASNVPIQSLLLKEMRWRARRYAVWLSTERAWCNTTIRDCADLATPLNSDETAGKKTNIVYNLPADVARYVILFL